MPAEDVALPPPAPVPGPGLAPGVYGLDAGGFIQELEGLLTGNVAGYSIRLNENGSTIGLASQNWAKEPQDGSEAWTPDTRMHVASLSKIVTAAAMTRLLAKAGRPGDIVFYTGAGRLARFCGYRLLPPRQRRDAFSAPGRVISGQVRQLIDQPR